MAANEFVIDLPQRFTVDVAEQVRKLMAKSLHCKKVEIKCRGSGVQIVDAAGIQLLLALHSSATMAGKRVVITNPSPLLSEAIIYSGADKVLATEEVV